MFPGPPEPRRTGHRRERTQLVALAVTVGLLLFIGGSWLFSGRSPSAATPIEPSVIPPFLPIGIITDLDQRSRVEGSKKPTWHAVFKQGSLKYDEASNTFSVEWTEETQLESKHSEAGRGMELSELARFGDRLFTFGDRTGIVYEVLNYRGTGATVVPRSILMEGDGDTDKGFKCEWAAVKGSSLYVGSFGKEYTNPDGSIRNKNNNWVMILDRDGKLVRREDWTEGYEGMRASLGYSLPGYFIHEAAVWNPFTSKWLFFPRRASKEAYDEDKDERMGTNMVIEASEDLTTFSMSTVGEASPLRGFSTAKLVPGSHGDVVAAIKSEETADPSASKPQTSYLLVFNWRTGEILMPETEIPGGAKYEGLEFL